MLEVQNNKITLKIKKCRICRKEEKFSYFLGFCLNCLRKKPKEALVYAQKAHSKIRKNYNLPAEVPKVEGGVSCNICAHNCKIGPGQKSYCGLRENKENKLISKVSIERALLHLYLDPIPTNCCASWFCPGSKEVGYYNLAVFAYGCGFNCLFCQNYNHKNIDFAPSITSEEFIKKALDPKITCLCFFGGSIEPQLPFALDVSEKILTKKRIRICWEWNGIGDSDLVRKAAEISLKSGGNIKFDLKCYEKNLSLALCGVDNSQAYKNFEMIAREFFPLREEPVLNATTLLVPYYVDRQEVENISKFIAKLNENIPYSLLVFYPDFCMRDLPITPRKQVEECYQAAKKYLKRVNIGNIHLLSFSE